MDKYDIIDVYPDIALGFVTLQDDAGNTLTVINSELRDLGRCLIALADEAGE